jgi:hypothetical protein
MKLIAEQIRSHLSEGIVKSYHLLFTPLSSEACTRVLEEEGVYGSIWLLCAHVHT